MRIGNSNRCRFLIAVIIHQKLGKNVVLVLLLCYCPFFVVVAGFFFVVVDNDAERFVSILLLLCMTLG